MGASGGQERGRELVLDWRKRPARKSTHMSAATRVADLRGQKKKTNTDKNHNNLLLIYPLENLFP